MFFFGSESYPENKNFPKTKNTHTQTYRNQNTSKKFRVYRMNIQMGYVCNAIGEVLTVVLTVVHIKICKHRIGMPAMVEHSKRFSI